MNATTANQNRNSAFALGGLAGNNAFGAGFLQAALDKEKAGEIAGPLMITATSGQIYWVYQYLKLLAKNENRGPNDTLKHLLANDIADLTPPCLIAGLLHNLLPDQDKELLDNLTKWQAPLFEQMPFGHDFAMAWLNMFGKPGRYKTAYPQALQESMGNVVGAIRATLKNLSDQRINQVSAIESIISILPDGTIQPDFPPDLFDKIARTFNDLKEDDQHGIGIVFNSYNPKQGIEKIYLNERARALLNRTYGTSSKFRQRTEFHEIDGDAVRAALWLYAYGFKSGQATLDGAYYREVILSEACGKGVNTIYSVRPINWKWLGELPGNYISSKDLETEVSFNGSYAGERDKIMLINKLSTGFGDSGLTSKDQNLTPESKKFVESMEKYHTIQLKEAEPNNQRGYLQYLFEDQDLFECGYKEGMRLLEYNPPLADNSSSGGKN